MRRMCCTHNAGARLSLSEHTVAKPTLRGGLRAVKVELRHKFEERLRRTILSSFKHLDGFQENFLSNVPLASLIIQVTLCKTLEETQRIPSAHILQICIFFKQLVHFEGLLHFFFFCFLTFLPQLERILVLFWWSTLYI